MQRRAVLAAGAALSGIALWPATAGAARYQRALVLVELKGGNDGLNTVVPYTDPHYARLRPTLALGRSEVLHLDHRHALHPALEPLMPLWQQHRLAVVQGVGYLRPDLFHFRSAAIWHTGSDSRRHLDSGWAARALALTPPPAHFAADGVVLGTREAGPLAGSGPRTLVLADTRRFARQARLATSYDTTASNRALAHVLTVERTAAHAAARLHLAPVPDTHALSTFPNTPFGHALAVTARILAGPAPVAAVKVTLGGFDTHANQVGVHDRRLTELARGLSALAAALHNAGRWRNTLVMTTSEFGRRPAENGSRGTDHGTAGPQLLMGGGVRGGLYGQPPDLARLDHGGNLSHRIDFRQLYATVLEGWWQIPSRSILEGRFQPLPLV